MSTRKVDYIRKNMLFISLPRFTKKWRGYSRTFRTLCLMHLQHLAQSKVEKKIGWVVGTENTADSMELAGSISTVLIMCRGGFTRVPARSRGRYFPHATVSGTSSPPDSSTTPWRKILGLVHHPRVQLSSPKNPPECLFLEDRS